MEVVGITNAEEETRLTLIQKGRASGIDEVRVEMAIAVRVTK